jgi:hypothetical protein
MNIQLLIKLGAVIGSFGTISLIIFAVILLIFPVSKDCTNNSIYKCNYISKAPYPLNRLINPIILLTILTIISIGIVVIRSGKWYSDRKLYYQEKDNRFG